MLNRIDDEVFESLLKAAVIQNSLNQIDDYPTSEELEKLVISDTCDRKIRKMIKNYWRVQGFTKALKVARKSAAMFAVFLGLSFMVLLSFNEVRAACYNVIIQVYEKYIEFDFSTSYQNSTQTIKLGYIPDGYYKSEDKIMDSGYYVQYKNNADDIIEVFFKDEANITLDNEHYEISDIKVNDAEGKLFVSIDPQFPNQLIWHNETGSYRLKSSLREKEMLKIAKNIK